LIKVASPSLEQKIHVKKNIHVEIEIAIALAQINSGNYLHICGKVYGITKNTSLIVRELCLTFKNHLKPLMILKLIKDEIKKSLLVLIPCMEFCKF
jgi:hypothetical protein